MNSVGGTCLLNSNVTASRPNLSNSKTSDDSENIVEEEKQFCLKFLNLESAEYPHLLRSSIVQWDELTGRSDDTGPKDESREAFLSATEPTE